MSIKHVNDADFANEVLGVKGKTVFVDFWATWCGPCRALAPHYEAASESFADKAVFAKFNVDEGSEIPAQFGIRGIPTILVFDDGVLVDQVTGMMPAAQLNRFIEKNI